MSVHVLLERAPLSVDDATRAVSHAGAGAVSLFLGVVRDENDGRAVTLLEYEAYDAMAVREMKRIGEGLLAEFPGVRLAIVHRIGALQVGDLAVICAASSKHRKEAIEACRLAIERVKADVPIWKREHGPDGPYWVGWNDARCRGEAEHGHTHAHPSGHDEHR